MGIAGQKQQQIQPEDELSAVGADRRVHTRHDARMPATLFFDPGNHSIACTVRNISTGGARIVLAEPSELPAAVQILVRPDVYRHALVRWRIGLEAGLEFIG
jgi:hypothetical protein